MSGKFLCTSAITLICGVLISCAKPKYIQESDTGTAEQKVQESKPECNLKFSNSGLCLLWFWEKLPNSTSEFGRLIFKTYRQNIYDQSPIETDLASLPHVVLWMPGMGHGSSPTETTKIDTGTYRSDKVLFIMPGEWEIRFQVKNGNEVGDEVRVNFVF